MRMRLAKITLKKEIRKGKTKNPKKKEIQNGKTKKSEKEEGLLSLPSTQSRRSHSQILFIHYQGVYWVLNISNRLKTFKTFVQGKTLIQG